MILKFTLATLKATLAVGVVIVFDHVMSQRLPPDLFMLLPGWCWLLPGERITQA